VEPEEISKLCTFQPILVNAQLKILGECLIKFVAVFLVLSNLKEKINALLDKVLAYDLEDLVLLQNLFGDVKRSLQCP